MLSTGTSIESGRFKKSLKIPNSEAVYRETDKTKLKKKENNLQNSESDCCLAPSEQLFIYIMVRKKLHFDETIMMSTGFSRIIQIVVLKGVVKIVSCKCDVFPTAFVYKVIE